MASRFSLQSLFFLLWSGPYQTVSSLIMMFSSLIFPRIEAPIRPLPTGRPASQFFASFLNEIMCFIRTPNNYVNFCTRQTFPSRNEPDNDFLLLNDILYNHHGSLAELSPIHRHIPSRSYQTTHKP